MHKTFIIGSIFNVPLQTKTAFLGPFIGPLARVSSRIFNTVKPVPNWANVCSPNILLTVRRSMIRFLIELLVRRTWFGQFDELYFVLSWLVMRCKLRPEFA